MIDTCPPSPPAHIVVVSRPLSIGLPESEFNKVLAGVKTEFATKRNPRKDRFFCAKRPRQARITALVSGRSVLRDIVSIKGTPEIWVVNI